MSNLLLEPVTWLFLVWDWNMGLETLLAETSSRLHITNTLVQWGPVADRDSRVCADISRRTGPAVRSVSGSRWRICLICADLTNNWLFTVAGQCSASAAFMEMPLGLESPTNSRRTLLASLAEMVCVEVEAEDLLLNI